MVGHQNHCFKLERVQVNPWMACKAGVMIPLEDLGVDRFRAKEVISELWLDFPGYSSNTGCRQDASSAEYWWERVLGPQVHGSYREWKSTNHDHSIPLQPIISFLQCSSDCQQLSATNVLVNFGWVPLTRQEGTRMELFSQSALPPLQSWRHPLLLWTGGTGEAEWWLLLM